MDPKLIKILAAIIRVIPETWKNELDAELLQAVLDDAAKEGK